MAGDMIAVLSNLHDLYASDAPPTGRRREREPNVETSLTVPADTLKFKTRPRQPNGRNWKYGDFADEPERF